MGHVARSDASINLLSDLAILGASALWGIGTSQTFRFFYRYREEPRRFVVLVSWLCVVDTLRQCFTLYSEITLFFNTIAYFSPTTIWAAGIIMPYLLSALVAVTAQSFFTYRIYIMSERQKFIPIVAMPTIFFQLCVAPIYFNAVSSNVVSIEAQRNLLVASLATGAAIDISLSAGLCALLWRQYMRDGPVLKSTNLMLQRIILFSVNTGMWTALAAFVVIIVFLRTETSDFMVFGYFHLMSPIYFATVLANLNARHYLRRDESTTFPSHLFVSRNMGFSDRELPDGETRDEEFQSNVGQLELFPINSSMDTDPDFIFQAGQNSDPPDSDRSSVSRRQNSSLRSSNGS